MAGFGAAAAVHAALVLALFLPRAPGVRGLALTDDQPGMAVSLVRLSASASQPQTAEQIERDRLESLRAALAGPAAPADPSPPQPALKPAPESLADSAALLKTFDQRHGGAPAASKPAPAAQAAAAGGSGDDPYARASVPSPDQLAPRTSSLWPQLQRCWKPERSFPPVKLSVTLDPRGGLSEPPSVVRDPWAKADPERLRAEAEAVRAVIACAPYAVATGAPRSFELAFAG